MYVNTLLYSELYIMFTYWICCSVGCLFLTSCSKIVIFLKNVTITGIWLQNSAKLNTYGLCTGRDLYRATPAVTRGLGFAVSAEVVALFDKQGALWAGLLSLSA